MAQLISSHIKLTTMFPSMSTEIPKSVVQLFMGKLSPNEQMHIIDELAQLDPEAFGEREVQIRMLAIMDMAYWATHDWNVNYSGKSFYFYYKKAESEFDHWQSTAS